MICSNTESTVSVLISSGFWKLWNTVHDGSLFVLYLSFTATLLGGHAISFMVTPSRTPSYNEQFPLYLFTRCERHRVYVNRRWFQTRMHSSMMRTVRFLPYGGPLSREGLCLGGSSVQGGLCQGDPLPFLWKLGLCPGGPLSGGGSLSRGSLSGRPTSLPVDRQTPVKLLPCPNFIRGRQKSKTFKRQFQCACMRRSTLQPSHTYH